MDTSDISLYLQLQMPAERVSFPTGKSDLRRQMLASALSRQRDVQELETGARLQMHELANQERGRGDNGEESGAVCLQVSSLHVAGCW